MASPVIAPKAMLCISPASLSGGSNDNRWTLAADNINIGRSQCNDIVLPYSWVSRQHAMIQRDESNTYTIIDLGSSNGTLVNHRLIHAPVKLATGDIISMGDTDLIFTQETGSRTQEQSDKLLDDETVVCLQLKRVCILVCDIRRYTALSEQLGVERIGELLRLWYKAMSDVVTEHGGEVDKFIGDAVLAVWSGENGQPQVM